MRTNSNPSTGLQLRSLVKPSGELEISLVDEPVAQPAADEVVLRIEAAPINPSDIGLLFGAADMGTAKVAGTADRPVVTAGIPERFMKSMAGRLGQSLP
ncbi:MAG TPA: NADH oxidase, partial [Burkholderiaceae bacterium]|nr:NADH oxidase [Burkholderiaceae bacterium]